MRGGAGVRERGGHAGSAGERWRQNLYGRRQVSVTEGRDEARAGVGWRRGGLGDCCTIIALVILTFFETMYSHRWLGRDWGRKIALDNGLEVREDGVVCSELPFQVRTHLPFRLVDLAKVEHASINQDLLSSQ